MFGCGKHVPKVENFAHEIDAVTFTNQTSIAKARIFAIPPVPSDSLKIPVFTKLLITASKRTDFSEIEVSKTVKKPKKQDKSISEDAPDLTKSNSIDHTGGVAKPPANPLERLLLEAGVCWANFASFMSIQADAKNILQPLQVAQLKRIVKLNPKGSKMSGTKSELVERIVDMLKAA